MTDPRRQPLRERFTDRTGFALPTRAQLVRLRPTTRRGWLVTAVSGALVAVAVGLLVLAGPSTPPLSPLLALTSGDQEPDPDLSYSIPADAVYLDGTRLDVDTVGSPDTLSSDLWWKLARKAGVNLSKKAAKYTALGPVDGTPLGWALTAGQLVMDAQSLGAAIGSYFGSLPSPDSVTSPAVDDNAAVIPAPRGAAERCYSRVCVDLGRVQVDTDTAGPGQQYVTLRNVQTRRILPAGCDGTDGSICWTDHYDASYGKIVPGSDQPCQAPCKPANLYGPRYPVLLATITCASGQQVETVAYRGDGAYLGEGALQSVPGAVQNYGLFADGDSHLYTSASFNDQDTLRVSTSECYGFGATGSGTVGPASFMTLRPVWVVPGACGNRSTDPECIRDNVDTDADVSISTVLRSFPVLPASAAVEVSWQCIGGADAYAFDDDDGHGVAVVPGGPDGAFGYFDRDTQSALATADTAFSVPMVCPIGDVVQAVDVEPAFAGWSPSGAEPTHWLSQAAPFVGFMRAFPYCQTAPCAMGVERWNWTDRVYLPCGRPDDGEVFACESWTTRPGVSTSREYRCTFGPYTVPLTNCAPLALWYDANRQEAAYEPAAARLGPAHGLTPLVDQPAPVGDPRPYPPSRSGWVTESYAVTFNFDDYPASTLQSCEDVNCETRAPTAWQHGPDVPNYAPGFGAWSFEDGTGQTWCTAHAPGVQVDDVAALNQAMADGQALLAQQSLWALDTCHRPTTAVYPSPTSPTPTDTPTDPTDTPSPTDTPTDPTDTPSPTATPDPADDVPDGECPTGLGLLNPFNLGKTFKCALVWAFVPPDGSFDNFTSRISTAYNDSVLGKWLGVIGSVGILNISDGTCEGVPVDLPQFSPGGGPSSIHVDMFRYCEEPWKTLALVVKSLLTVIVAWGTGVACFRNIASSFGLDTKWGSSSGG